MKSATAAVTVQAIQVDAAFGSRYMLWLVTWLYLYCMQQLLQSMPCYISLIVFLVIFEHAHGVCVFISCCYVVAMCYISHIALKLCNMSSLR